MQAFEVNTLFMFMFMLFAFHPWLIYIILYSTSIEPPVFIRKGRCGGGDVRLESFKALMKALLRLLLRITQDIYIYVLTLL